MATNLFYASGPHEEAIFFDVKRGASIRGVSSRLEERGIISSAVIFRMGADYTKRTSKLKFGHYAIPERASMDEILDIVTRGGASVHRYRASLIISGATAELRLSERDLATRKNVEILRYKVDEERPAHFDRLIKEGATILMRVVVAEGATSWQVANALRAADFLRGEISDIPKEGRLAPGAYDVSMGADRATLIEKMERQQNVFLAELWEVRQPDLPIKTAYEALILASVIEKETGVSKERKLIASVFINRLNKGMRMQSDPTVIYGITRGEGSFSRALKRSELKKETLWNTYSVGGLPPTPIANPGREAIHAALNPAETDYIFFVADGSGEHAFAVTLAEHNKNVLKWRRLQKESQ